MNLRLLWVLLTIAAVAYWPVIHGTYLMNWDDNHQIVNNPDVTNLNWESFKHFFTNFYIRSYQPLASLSYSIEYAIFGNNPMVPHFTNYLLHLLNIVLVMRFLSRLLPDRGQLVLLTTAVFALNPIQVETVAWISTRSTLLFSGLFIISCEIYLCYLAEQKRKWLSLCGVTFLLGLLCKSAMLTLPAVLALFDFYKKRKITRATVLEKIPFALLSVIFAIVNMASRDFTLEIKSEFDQYYSITQRLCLGAYSFLFYIGKALVPISLRNFYDYPLKDTQGQIAIQYTLCLIFVFLLFIAWLSLPKKTRDLVPDISKFGFSFFLINVVLILAYFSFQPSMLSERYDYIAIIGLGLMFIPFLEKLFEQPRFQKAALPVVTAIALLYTTMDQQQSKVWENPETLWGHGAQEPTARHAKNQYAIALHARGQLGPALEYYNEAVKLDPYDTDVYLNRGLLIADLGDLDYAKKDFTRIIDAQGVHPAIKIRAYRQRAKVEEVQKDLPAAEADLKEALALELTPAEPIAPRTHPVDHGLKTAPPESMDNIKVKILEVAKQAFAKNDFETTIRQCETYLLLDPTSEEAKSLLIKAKSQR